MYLFFLKGNKFQNSTQMEYDYLGLFGIIFEVLKIFL
jgi:hypothetical protein